MPGTPFLLPSVTPSGLADSSHLEHLAALQDGDVRLLAQAGFMAAGVGDVARARVVFEALQPLRPDQAWPWLGIASALMNARKPAEAASLLEPVRLADAGQQAMLRAFLGLALQLDERSGESLRVLRAVAFDTTVADSEGARLARRMLGEKDPA